MPFSIRKRSFFWVPPACALLCKLFPCHSHLSAPSGLRQPLTPELSVGFFVLDLQYFSNNNNNKVVASLCAGCCQTSQSCLQHGNGLRAMTARGKVSCKRDQEEVCELLAAPSPAVRVRKSGEVLLVSDCCFTSSGWTLLAGTLFQFLNYVFRNLLIFLHLCPFIVNMFSSSADSHRSKLHDTPGVTESEAVHDVFS